MVWQHALWIWQWPNSVICLFSDLLGKSHEGTPFWYLLWGGIRHKNRWYFSTKSILFYNVDQVGHMSQGGSAFHFWVDWLKTIHHWYWTYLFWALFRLYQGFPDPRNKVHQIAFLTMGVITFFDAFPDTIAWQPKLLRLELEGPKTQNQFSMCLAQLLFSFCFRNCN
jgi:hypothetical protein